MTDQPIATAAKTREILSAFGLNARKKWGQNFIIEPTIVEKMAAVCGAQDVAIEVGPGLGALTQALAGHANKVIAYEIDTSLKPVLAQTLAAYDNVQIRWQDFMETDLTALVKEIEPEDHLIVAANLPYYITTPILFKIFNGPTRIERLVVMMQKEVAQRFLACAGGKDYNALTVVSQYQCEAKLIANVNRHCYLPVPDVDSAVVLFTRRPYPIQVKDEAGFTTFVRSCFAQRRKTLANNLKQAGYAANQINEGIGTVSSKMDIRAEQLKLDDFIKLYEVMGNV